MRTITISDDLFIFLYDMVAARGEEERSYLHAGEVDPTKDNVDHQAFADKCEEILYALTNCNFTKKVENRRNNNDYRNL